MDYILSNSTDPAWNLALEQYVFDSLPGDRSYFMLWQNADTIVVGRYQNTLAELNEAYVRAENITVVRRLSGGGAVYHDMGNLNFTFITDADQTDKINFRMFCEPVMETIASYGVQAELSGRNDMTVDGKKFSGNAQYIKKGRTMHHGTIMISSDLARVAKALQVDRSKMESKGVKSVASRVTNLCDYIGKDVSVEEFRNRLVEIVSKKEVLVPYVLTDTDKAAIERIRRERYDSWEWNYGKSPACTMHVKERIEGCGIIELFITSQNSCISEIHFFGDFFCTGDIAVLESTLAGCALIKEELEKRISDCAGQCAIRNLTPTVLAGLILQ